MDRPKNQAFARRLSDAMFNRDYDPADLSRAAKIPYNTIRGYLGGTVSPTIGPLKKLCDTLRVSADYLIGREERSA